MGILESFQLTGLEQGQQVLLREERENGGGGAEAGAGEASRKAAADVRIGAQVFSDI